MVLVKAAIFTPVVTMAEAMALYLLYDCWPSSFIGGGGFKFQNGLLQALIYAKITINEINLFLYYYSIGRLKSRRFGRLSG